jgi:hypothetical protein
MEIRIEMEYPRAFTVVLAALSTLIVGCGSFVSRGLLPEVVARRPPGVQLGSEVVVFQTPPVLNTCLIDMNGAAHLFLVGKDKELSHVEVHGDEVVCDEVLGVIETVDSWTAIDAVEHPPGKLRVLIGNTLYVRYSAGLEWQQVKGNRCTRFLPAGDDLLCAFVINGEEVGSPKRWDPFVGLFFIIPVFWLSHNFSDKLVLALEGPDGWVVRAVLDPDTPLDAHRDFVVDVDSEENANFLYFSSTGEGILLVGGSPYSVGVVSHWPKPGLQYARAPLRDILGKSPKPQNGEPSEVEAEKHWVPISGANPSAMPFLKRDMFEELFQVDKAKEMYPKMKPLSRHFVLNKVTGQAQGLVSPYGMTLTDGVRKVPFYPRYGSGWIEITLEDGMWSQDIHFVAADDFPAAGYNWSWDENMTIKGDGKGNCHALIMSSNKRHDRCMTYLFKGADGWYAPVTLGKGKRYHEERSLAVSESGTVFAAWVNDEGRFIGRWIRPLGSHFHQEK